MIELTTQTTIETGHKGTDLTTFETLMNDLVLCKICEEVKAQESNFSSKDNLYTYMSMISKLKEFRDVDKNLWKRLGVKVVDISITHPSENLTKVSLKFDFTECDDINEAIEYSVTC